jgi:uncharacterized protein YjbI with pentapeptide repeats
MSDPEEPALRPANDNPWYCLATLYGEQPPNGFDWKTDLAAKNRNAWNRWIAGGLTDKQCTNLLKNDFPKSELVLLTPEEKKELCNAFASRTGRDQDLPPDPSDIIDFAHTRFDNTVILAGFLCAETVDFSSSVFLAEVDLSTTFYGYANFGSVKFCSTATFKSATFYGFANFKSATLSRYANFESAKFVGGANFGEVKFSGYADFELTAFFSHANFDSAKFFGLTDFESATFSCHADFSRAKFTKDGLFINAGFTANTIFANAQFETGVPDFRGAKMHEATEWHGVHWPPAPKDEDAAQTQVYAYERLKQEMERLKKHEDEQSFFRKELRARRGLVPPWSGTWLLYYAYEVSSGYGQSILRPTLWLLALLVFGIAVFVGFPVFEGARMAIPRAATLSFANIFSFLPIKREIMTTQMVEGLSSAAQVVGVVQSLFGIVLLFLLGLALRSRFRMR